MSILRHIKVIQYGKWLKACSTLKSSIRNISEPVLFSHLIRDFPETQCSVLSNGLTIATEERYTPNACVGLYINSGSRHENESNNGITHFFEHIAFKSTKKRSKNVLRNEISYMGARFKCFTTREIVVYYVECLSKDVPWAVDVLFDCIYNNAFDSNEIEIQKNIVYQEMLNHDQSTEGVMYDYLHSTAFQGTSLAQTVMGPSNNLNKFKPTDIMNFIYKMFSPQRVVMASAGGVMHEQMVTLASHYLFKEYGDEGHILGPKRYTGSEIVYRDDSIPVAHIAIAVEGPSFCDDEKLSMDLASSVIGAWDASQPGGLDHGTYLASLASAGRFCESYKAFNFYYHDTGLCGVEFVSPRLEVDDMMMAIQKEWMKLCHIITDGELIKAKNELKSQLLTDIQTSTGACLDIGLHVLHTGCRPSISERIKEIDEISADMLRRDCEKFFCDKCPVVAAVGSTECLMPYGRTRDYMYWLRA